MKIEPPKLGFTDEVATIAALEILIRQPSVNEVRPCQSCKVRCKCMGSLHCACQCSATCSSIATALSVEPDRYPIEPGITRLVFEFNALRLFQTSWSCEGHLNSYGMVNKLPRIWFYTSSSIYPQLVAQYLSRLMHTHRLQYTWGVLITSLNGEIYCTYSLEPLLDHTTQPDIKVLHRDLDIISEDFANQIKRLAETHLHQLNQHQALVGVATQRE